MQFFTSDTHFTLVDYEGTVLRDYRPFKSVSQMNKKIIQIWNKQAKKDDVIYHLGDFINYNLKDKVSYKETFKFVKKIKAKVILILGNNEERLVKYEFNDDFESFKKYLIGLGFYDVVMGGMYANIGDQKFYLNHFPKNHKDGVINLFGHIHNCCFVKKYGFNVGVDNHYFRLFSESDILDIVDKTKYFDENVYE